MIEARLATYKELNQLDKLLASYGSYESLCEGLIKLKLFNSFDDLSKEMLHALGLSYDESSQKPAALMRPLEELVFCFVDLEASSSLKQGGQIMEIGAIKYKAGQELGRFECLLQVPFIDISVQKVTGIEMSMLEGACNMKQALFSFKEFLQDSVFVAHNALFDHRFLSVFLCEIGIGPLLNPRLCSFELATRCMDAPRFGLDALKEILGIKLPAHRAFNDAFSCAGIFFHCLKMCDIKNTKELFSYKIKLKESACTKSPTSS